MVSGNCDRCEDAIINVRRAKFIKEISSEVYPAVTNTEGVQMERETTGDERPLTAGIISKCAQRVPWPCLVKD